MHAFGTEFAGTPIINTTASLYSDGWTRDSAPLVDSWVKPGHTFATLNPLDKAANIVLSNGNLTAGKNNTSMQEVRANIGISSGKCYWEVKINSYTSFGGVGVMSAGASLTSALQTSATGLWQYEGFNGYKYYPSSSDPFGATYGAGSVIGLAYNAEAGILSLYKDGILQGTITAITGTVYPMVGIYTAGNTFTANFGATPFVYDPPTGFNPGLYIPSSTN